jgi:hypothetical protein
MKSKILVFLIIILSTSSISFSREFKAVVDSSPQKATIYTEGFCTFEEQLSEKVDDTTAVKLPAETVVDSIEISRGSQKITNVTVTPFEMEYSEQNFKKSGSSDIIVESNRHKTVYYLISLNEKNGGENSSPMNLKYTVKGLSWRPIINANITKNNKVNLCFDAIITNNVLNIDNVIVSLASVQQKKNIAKMDTKRYENQDEPLEEYYPWQKVNFSTNLYAEYPIGSIALPKATESTKIINIFCKNTDIADTIYMWKTKEKIVKKFSYINNPFTTPLCKGDITIVKNNIILATKESEWVEPNESMLLLEEDENGVACNSSIEVTEDFEKRNLWQNCRNSNTQRCDSKNALFYLQR